MQFLRLRFLAAALVAGGASLAWSAESTATPDHAKATPQQASTTIEKGRYLATLGDCTGCHTAKGGKPFAGGMAIDTGFGKVFSPNITPDKQTGIGTWSKDDFYRALHTGHDDEGKHLYPAFPYAWYTKVTRADVDALKDYFESVEPVHNENKPPQLAWWMSWRAEMFGWNLLYFDKGEFKPDASRSAEWNRGAYIVEGLAHCGDCHTQKTYFGGAIDAETLAGGYTKGGHRNGWFAPSLRNQSRAGLGDWSEAEIVQYLKTGSNARTAAAGPMVEVIDNSTRYFKDADLKAVAVYLKSWPAKHEEPKPQGLPRRALEQGEALFVDNCAACHMHDGKGIKNFIPALAGSSAIQSREPSTVMRVVLEGAKVPAKPGQHGYIAMPAFGHKLDDSEVASVVSYIRNAWGNRGSPVDADTIATERKALASESK